MYPNACIMSERKANDSDKSFTKNTNKYYSPKNIAVYLPYKELALLVLNERDDPSEVEHCFTHTVLAV